MVPLEFSATKTRPKRMMMKDKVKKWSRDCNFWFKITMVTPWYWELVETIRKVLLTSGLILVGGESRAYVGLACVISGLYGMFFAYKRPIVDPV